MKRKNVTKAASFAICAAMLTGAIPVSAANAADSRYSLSCFQTFGNYVKEDNSAVFPDGWGKWQQGAGAEALRGETENTSGSQAMYITGGGIPMFSFGSLVQEGIAHIGFDMKLESTDSKIRIMGSTDFTGSKNPNSYYHDNWALGVQNYYIDVNAFKDKKVSLFTGEAGINAWSPEIVESLEADTSWHRYDLIFDLNNKTYTPYVDGEKIIKETTYNEDGDVTGYTYYENLTSNYNLKNIYFQTSGSTGIWIDNFTAENYASQAEGILKAPTVKADYNNGKVDLAISEAADLSKLTANDFKAVNFEDNQEISAKGVNVTATGLSIDFGELENGTYSLVVPEITGKISGKTGINKAVFSVNNSMIVNEQSTVLMNQNFADYNGGIPNGWTALGENYDGANKTAAATDTGANAFKLSGDKEGSYYYTFDNGYKIQGENFSIEFDVNSENAGWGIGIVRDSDMNTYGASTMDRTDEAFMSYNNIIRPQKVRNMFAGSYEDGKFVIQNSMWNLYTLPNGTDAYAGEIKNNQWNHVKLDVNMQACTVDVYVNGTKLDTKSYPPEMFALVMQTDADRISNKKFYHCVSGLRLEKQASCSAVSFANIKVSKNTSYLTYQDFEGRTASNNDIGWYIPYYNTWFDGMTAYGAMLNGYYNDVNQSLTATEGKNGGKALCIKPREGLWTLEHKTILSKPVEAGKGFVIEFDAKRNAALSTWYLMANTSENVDTTNKTEFAGGVQDGKLAVGNMNQYLLYYGENNRYFGDDANDESISPVEVAADKWYHYKYTVSPAPNGTDANKYQVSVQLTDESGKTEQRYVALWNGDFNVRLRTKDTAAISFAIDGDTSNQPGAELAIDNLKVWQVEANDTVGIDPIVKSATMTTVTAENYNGTVSYIKNTTSEISANTKNISVAFSGNVSEGDIDKISLKADGSEIGTKSISGNVVNISLTGVQIAGKSVTLSIDSGITAGESQTQKAYEYTMTAANDAGLYITSIDLYENVATTNADIAAGITGTADVLVKDIKAIKGTPKFIIKGYNTGREKSVFLAGADYTSTNGNSTLNAAASDEKTASVGTEFAWELPAETLINGNGNVLKAFVWEASTQKALINNYSTTK